MAATLEEGAATELADDAVAAAGRDQEDRPGVDRLRLGLEALTLSQASSGESSSSGDEDSSDEDEDSNSSMGRSSSRRGPWWRRKKKKGGGSNGSGSGSEGRGEAPSSAPPPASSAAAKAKKKRQKKKEKKKGTSSGSSSTSPSHATGGASAMVAAVSPARAEEGAAAAAAAAAAVATVTRSMRRRAAREGKQAQLLSVVTTTVSTTTTLQLDVGGGGGGTRAKPKAKSPSSAASGTGTSSGSGSGSEAGAGGKKKKGKKKKEKKPKPLPGLEPTVQHLTAGMGRGEAAVLEVHAPRCACRVAYWLPAMAAAELMGYVASTTGPGKILAALVASSPSHTLDGERDAVARLTTAALGQRQIKAARCCRLTVEPTLGEPSFLHGAAIIVGDRAHLQALAATYGFRGEAQRQGDDEACCLLVAPLPSSSSSYYSGGGGSTPSPAVARRAQDVGKALLRALGARPVAAKAQANKVEHHLQTMLRGLTRERVLRASGSRGFMLREPAILAMCQEWPERYTIDAFGGKRDLGESSLQAAIRETAEESGEAVRLEDGQRFARLPALDIRDNAMAFFGFLYRGEHGAAPIPVRRSTRLNGPFAMDVDFDAFGQQQEMQMQPQPQASRQWYAPVAVPPGPPAPSLRPGRDGAGMRGRGRGAGQGGRGSGSGYAPRGCGGASGGARGRGSGRGGGWERGGRGGGERGGRGARGRGRGVGAGARR